MSAPHTNIAKQRRRHLGPLIGVAAAALFGVVLIVYWVFEEAAEGTPPQGADVQIDGRTGEPSTSEPVQGVQSGPGPVDPQATPEPQTVTPGPEELPAPPPDVPQ